MSHNNQYDVLPFNPNLAYLPQAHPGLPPPGTPFENLHPPVPMGPPAVLVKDVAKVLELLQGELGCVVTITTDLLETTHELSETIQELSGQVKSLEEAVQKLNPSARDDTDDEGSDGEEGKEQPHPCKCPWSLKETAVVKQPTKGERGIMFLIIQKALYSGCEVPDMNGLKEGLTGNELVKRIAKDPALPWLPNFRLSSKHEDNAFWVNKNIIPMALDHPDAKEPLEKGEIPREFWMADYLRDHIVK
ncbi:hypothetical protein FRC11_005591 [Ceratobasidium sp. 423]|nr:hypothetical protein FRC11_005591 [Ceratobasidium sp. 423]